MAKPTKKVAAALAQPAAIPAAIPVPPAPTPTDTIPSSGVTITTARISNFRSIKNAEMALGDLTILIGANNVGKTSLLDALQAAIGASRRNLGKEDIHLDNDELDAPKERNAIIDILIRPVDDIGAIVDNFPPGSFWTGLWGGGISQDAQTLNDQVIIRTVIEWNFARGDYWTTRHFLKEWKPIADWLAAEEGGAVTAGEIDPIALHYIDAKRDLDDDLRSRTSFWRRLTDDLNLTDDQIKSLEATLTALNQEILDKSEVLQHLRETLLGLQNVVASRGSAVDIAPVPRRLRDLSKGVDVTLSTSGTQAFPLTRHGMGTRSLASLLVFRAFASWRQKKSAAEKDLVHTLLALEEPEAHLHPHAQRALFKQIKLIPGQRIVSTHSPYFAAQSRLEDMRLVTRSGGNTHVAALDLSQLSPDQRRKLDREVISSRGDLLFARAVILFEGETEEQAFPIFAEQRWGATIHELGFSFVGVSGGNYFPFLWLAKNFEIPWYVVSDGEPQPVATLKSELGKIGASVTDANVTVIPNNNDYEAQLIAEGYLDAVEAAIARQYGPTAFDDYMTSLHGMNGRKVNGVQIKRDYQSAEARERAATDFMREKKTRVAAPVAYEIVSLADPNRRIPKCLIPTFDVLSKDFNL